MCQCQVPGTLLHKNRWSQGQSSPSSSSSPLLYSLQFPYLAFFSLSLQSSSLPFPEHTRERLFGQLAVISSWFGSLCSFDQTVAPRQKPERMRVQLWLGHSLNWARRPEEKEEEGGGKKKKIRWEGGKAEKGERGRGRSWGLRTSRALLLLLLLSSLSYEFTLLNCVSLLFQLWTLVKYIRSPSSVLTLNSLSNNLRLFSLWLPRVLDRWKQKCGHCLIPGW